MLNTDSFTNIVSLARVYFIAFVRLLSTILWSLISLKFRVIFSLIAWNSKWDLNFSADDEKKSITLKTYEIAKQYVMKIIKAIQLLFLDQ